jgi:hypothetical protein
MISCFGDNDGSVLVSVSGGTPGYVNTINSTSGLFTGLSQGTYEVTTTDGNGCAQSFSTVITEPTQVNLSAIPSTATSGLSNGSITMSGSGGLSPYSYSINGTNYYSGSLFSNLSAGTYICYVKDANGCIDTLTATVDQIATLFEENSIQANLFPNPNNGIFEIQSSGLVGDKLDCKLFNIQGQLLSEFSFTITNGKVSQSVEMSRKLPAGKYFLGLYNQSNVVIKEFVKN